MTIDSNIDSNTFFPGMLMDIIVWYRLSLWFLMFLEPFFQVSGIGPIPIPYHSPFLLVQGVHGGEEKEVEDSRTARLEGWLW